MSSDDTFFMFRSYYIENAYNVKPIDPKYRSSWGTSQLQMLYSKTIIEDILAGDEVGTLSYIEADILVNKQSLK